MLVLAIGCSFSDGPAPASGPAAAVAVGLEPNIDRPGADYRDFSLSTARADACRAACLTDDGCAAFTYVRPGVQGPFARCWLKDTVVPAVANGCCTSGVKSYAGPTPGTDSAPTSSTWPATVSGSAPAGPPPPPWGW
jgi:PAN domain